MQLASIVNAAKVVHAEAPRSCPRDTQKVTLGHARKSLPAGRCGAQMRCQAAGRRFDLVTTDVDGTLLNSKNELSARNEEAIAECIKLGIPVGPCMLPYARW